MAKHIKQQVSIIPLSSVAFLKLLKKNNDRDWFAKHKDEFIKEQSYIETFADALSADSPAPINCALSPAATSVNLLFGV